MTYRELILELLKLNQDQLDKPARIDLLTDRHSLGDSDYVDISKFDKERRINSGPMIVADYRRVIADYGGQLRFWEAWDTKE